MDEERTREAGRFAELLRNARSDPDGQLGRLLQGFRPYLEAIAQAELAGGVLGKMEAADFAQSTFLEAVRDFRTFGGESEADFQKWLGRILRNNIRDARRAHVASQKRNPLREVSDPEFVAGLAADHSTPSERAMRNEQSDALESALLRLTPEKRKLIRLHNHEGKPFKEIGLILGISPDAARKRWAGVIEELGEMLRANDGSGNTPVR